jgi:hypothetical protein
MTAHTTGTGHLPALAATSWACTTCGTAHITTYAPSAGPELAQRLAAEQAHTHQRIADLRRNLEQT